MSNEEKIYRHECAVVQGEIALLRCQVQMLRSPEPKSYITREQSNVFHSNIIRNLRRQIRQAKRGLTP